MTSTEHAPFWSDLGDHLPDEGTIPPPYAKPEAPGNQYAAHGAHRDVRRDGQPLG